MKNRVNISQLIEEKYKDKNTISAKEFDEIIDSVLEEGYNIASKVNDPGNAVFETSNEVQASAIVNGMSGQSGGDPRPKNAPEKGYQRVNPAGVVPDKLAEAPLGPPSSTESTTLKIPDILALVTNQNLKLASEGDADRQLIDNIIDNFGAGDHWINRIETLNNFIQSQIKGVSKSDFRKAISRLIYINLLKRMSFFVAQPGKSFEYVIAPIIGKDAKVIGGTDKDILDVTRVEEGTGYSIKFFTGEASNYSVEGSYDTLYSHTGKKEEKQPGSSKAINYILAIARKQGDNGYVDFIEMSVSTVKGHFDGYVPIHKFINGDGYLLMKDEGSYKKFGLYVNKIKGQPFDQAIKVVPPALQSSQDELDNLLKQIPDNFDPKVLNIDSLSIPYGANTRQTIKSIDDTLGNLTSNRYPNKD
jgi:hypothetical protein